MSLVKWEGRQGNIFENGSRHLLQLPDILQLPVDVVVHLVEACIIPVGCFDAVCHKFHFHSVLGIKSSTSIDCLYTRDGNFPPKI
mmetsp:Transcript_5310/g.9235  ORF Transcript_5310/g.9235 Transcript_5310/m.9235 type:complete len:85 (+) Transcript_5310:1008-1262(+)